MADVKRLGELLDADKPSEALTGVLQDPQWQCDLAELCALKGLSTDPKYGPFDPYDHTVMGMDLAAPLLKDYHVPRERRIQVMLALLLHDTGKAEFVRGERHKVDEPHHTEMSVRHARAFLNRFGLHGLEPAVAEMIWLHRRMLELPVDGPDEDFRAVLACVDHPLDLLIMTAANRVATAKELGEFEGMLDELPLREQALYHRFRQAA